MGQEEDSIVPCTRRRAGAPGDQIIGTTSFIPIRFSPFPPPPFCYSENLIYGRASTRRD